MNLPLHKTRRPALLILFLLIFVSAVHDPAQAQKQQEGKRRSNVRRAAVSTDEAIQERERARARRMEAVQLLVETAGRARLFDDLYYRAHIQALAADALWREDVVRARAIFQRAWEAATAADKAEQGALEQEERAVVTSSTLATSNLPITETRDEVLLKIAVRDPQLAQNLLRRMIEEERRSEEQSSQVNDARETSSPWGEMTLSAQRYLMLADALLEKREPARAAQIASALLQEGASAHLMAFLLRLRAESASDADALYLRLLERTRRDARADANTVLLLSSPIVSPDLLIVIDRQGSVQFRHVAHTSLRADSLTPVSQPARKAFYSVAASVLLRDFITSSSTNHAQQAIATYFTIGRLLSFFEREAFEFVPELRARQQMLLAEIEQSRRDLLSTQFNLQSLTPTRTRDPLYLQVEQLSHITDERERERLLIGIVKRASEHRLWDRARRAALEIKTEMTRRNALSFLAINQIADISRAYSEDDEHDYEGVVRFVRAADVPPLAGAWGLAQAAQIAARKDKPDKQRIRELINEAEQFAARVDQGTPQRVAAYAVVTLTAAQVDVSRAWELLPEMVRAANGIDDYTGDEATLLSPAKDDAAEQNSDKEDFSFMTEAFRLDAIFATMARLNFEKTLEAARSLRAPVPQAYASIATARSALDQAQERRR